MALLANLTNIDINNNIVASNQNIIAWYNGTKVKLYDRVSQVTEDVETISGVLSIKIESDTSIKISTSSKIRELTKSGSVWSGSDIIASVSMKNSTNNMHIIDSNTIAIVTTTDTQIYSDSGSGYVSDHTNSDSADIIGFNNEYFLNNNLYIYNDSEPTSDTRWITGTNTKFSLSLGSLGSLNNIPLSSGINAIEALTEIRQRVLDLNISGLSVSLPAFVNDINPNSGSINFQGYRIDINTGTSINETTSFTINDVNGDGQNIIHNYEYETDGAGVSESTVITLTEPDGLGTIILNVAADTQSDDDSDEIGNNLVTLINNNIETPNNYNASFDSVNQTITFTGETAFTSVPGQVWTASVDNGTVTGGDAGDISFGTASITVNGVINETYQIVAPNLNNTTINSLPIFSKVNFTGGNTTSFSNNIGATDAAIELRNALNNSLSGYITAIIDPIDNKKVTWTTIIQDDIGLDINFSDGTITKTITQGILGTTQTDINNAGNTVINVTKPGSASVDFTKNYLGFVPSLSGAVNTIQDLVEDINNNITDWTIEYDQPIAGSIQFTNTVNEYLNTNYNLTISNNSGTGTTVGDFGTIDSVASITQSGGLTPNYYGIRSVTLPNKDVLSNNSNDYSWFKTVKNSTNTILPGYKIESINTPKFAFDGEDINQTPELKEGYFAIPINVNGQAVIDTEALTISEIYNIPVDTPDTIIPGSELLYYSNKLYLAYRVNNDSDITSLSLGINDTGATIYTTKGSTYTITDSNTDVLIAEYIYKWNGTDWVKQT
jgi:hypothetical protein